MKRAPRLDSRASGLGGKGLVIANYSAPSRQFQWLAQPRLHGLFVGEILAFLLFKGNLIKHANHRN